MHWLDNLIPLHARLNERQLAGWTPSAVAEQGLGCRVLADVAIPLPDGTKLGADVYTPARTGRYPVILQFAAYNLDLHTAGVPKGSNEIGAPPIATDRGYVQVVVTARGIGRSQGRLQPWLCEAEIADHLACIDWAARQPWSNGQVCLFGTSYYGMNQPAVAARRPPALRAFFANEICTNYRRQLFRYGGVFNADFLSLWLGANFTPVGMRRRVPPVVRAALSHLINRPWVWRYLVRPHIDRIMRMFKHRRVAPEALDWYVALMRDAPDSIAPPISEGPYRDLHEIDMPFVVVQNPGLIALHQFGAYDLFEHAGSNRKWLIVGPPEYELPVYSWQLEALAFFDHIIKGTDNGYAQQPRVRYWRDGAADWVGADDFPPPDAEPAKLYPGAAAGDAGTLAADVPASAVSTWLSVPRGIAVLPGIDAVEPQRLRFRHLAREDFELAGPVTLQLSYACSEIDSYVVARLDRVDAEGKRNPLAMGHLRPTTRAIDQARSGRYEIAIDTSTPQPLRRDEPVVLRFSLTPAATLIRKGEALELDIASRTDLLHVPMRDGFIVPEMAVPPYFARNTLHHGPDTFLELTARYYVGST
jgi:predicted acyl esterase